MHLFTICLVTSLLVIGGLVLYVRITSDMRHPDPAKSQPRLHLSPARYLPVADLDAHKSGPGYPNRQALHELVGASGGPDGGPIVVKRHGKRYHVLLGRHRVEEAIRRGDEHVRAVEVSSIVHLWPIR